MVENARISYKQIIFITFTCRIIVAITYLPSLASPTASQDMWISDILSLPFLFIISVPIYLLWKRFPDKTIFEYSKIIGGKIGIIIGLLYVWFFIHFTAITICQYCFFLNSAVMPETPMLFFIITLVLLGMYMTYSGIEVICRVSELIFPVIIIAILAITLSLVNEMDFNLLKPVMETGMAPLLFDGYTTASRTVEILVIAMLLPYLNDKQKAKKVIVLSYVLIVIFFVIISILILITFGADLGKTLMFPIFDVIRLISLGGFYERVESIHMAIWILGGLIKISMYLYLATLGLSQSLNLNSYKPVVIPMGVFLVVLTFLISESIIELRNFTSSDIFNPYALVYIIIIPMILFLISIVRKKGATKN